MPSRENQDLHDMHALLQQMETLNSMHAPDHLGPYLPSIPSMPDLGITKAIKGARDAFNEHTEQKAAQKAAQKERDASVLTAWTAMKDDTTKRVALKKAVDAIDPNVLGPMLLGNAATKQQTQECILPSSA